MFSSIRIKNFQSHKDSYVELCPGVNVIAGKSQSGKTAIVRALLWLFNNASGAKYFSNFAGDEGKLYVELTCAEDDTKIALHKLIKKNKDGIKHVMPGVSQYHLDYASKENHIFSALKGGVPDEVAKKLGISELNCQKQLDMPFLVTSSPGEIARAINRITNLERADLWVSECSSRINQISAQIINNKQLIQDWQEELKKYNILPDVEKIWIQARDLDVKIRTQKRKQVEIDKAVVLIEMLRKQIQDIQNAIKMEIPLLKAEELQHKIDEKMKMKEDLLDYKTHFDLNEDWKYEFAMMKGEYIEFLRRNPRCPLCDSTINAKTIKKISEEL